MDLNKYDISISGPLHLLPPPHTWWNNLDHKRSVLACLVKGAYIKEKVRRAKIGATTGAAVAPPWWESFGFQLCEPILDDNGSYIGAIYQYKTPLPSPAPAYVVAFRGTINLRDMIHDIHLIRDKLQRKARSKIAIQAFLNFFRDKGNSNVWLAGHSLGSAIAMHIGKYMARNLGIYLDCFLFNPPFIMPPVERIKNEHLKRASHVVHRIAVTVFAAATRNQSSNFDMGPFLALSPWQPNLFVHDRDNICLGYIGYFGHGEWMEKMGLGCVERVASRNSIIGLIRKIIDGVQHAEEPLHLIPSANLTVNRSPHHFLEAHTLKQWWQPDLQLEFNTYRTDIGGSTYVPPVARATSDFYSA